MFNVQIKTEESVLQKVIFYVPQKKSHVTWFGTCSVLQSEVQRCFLAFEQLVIMSLGGFNVHLET